MPRHRCGVTIGRTKEVGDVQEHRLGNRRVGVRRARPRIREGARVAQRCEALCRPQRRASRRRPECRLSRPGRRARTRKKIQVQVEAARTEGFDASFETVHCTAGRTPHTIADFAQSVDADVIVVAGRVDDRRSPASCSEASRRDCSIQPRAPCWRCRPRPFPRRRMRHLQSPELEAYGLAADATDVILRDGTTLRLRPPTPRRRRRPPRTSSTASRAEPLPPLPRRPPRRPRARRAATSIRTGSSVARSSATLDDRDRRRRRVRAPPRPARPPRSPSPSPTSCRATASARACSSSSRPVRRRTASSASSPRSWPTTADAARLRDAGFEVARELAERRGRGRLPDRGDGALPRRASTSATTSPSPRRCGRSSRRRSVAVVGASRAAGLDRRRAVPQHPRRRLRRRRLPGQPAAASPSPACAAYRSIAEIRAPVDLVGHLRSRCAGARGRASGARRRRARALRHLLGLRRGRAPRARARQERLLALVRAHGARLVGPNCLGIAVPAIGLNATFAPRALPRGTHRASRRRAARSASRLLEKAAERNLGFSAFVSIGNKADVSSNDLLEWWEDDEETDLVLLYLESFGNPRKFGRLAAARRAHEADPRAEGRDDRAQARARRARTPPRSPAPDAAVDALFRQAGVLRARTLEELVDAAALLSSQPLPRGSPRRRRHQRRRPRHPLRRRVRGGRARAAASSPSRRRPRWPRHLAGRSERRQSGRSARLGDGRDLRGGAAPRSSPTRASTRVIVLFVPPVVAGADEVARRRSARAVDTAAAESRCWPS